MKEENTSSTFFGGFGHVRYISCECVCKMRVLNVRASVLCSRVKVRVCVPVLKNSLSCVGACACLMLVVCICVLYLFACARL